MGRKQIEEVSGIWSRTVYQNNDYIIGKLQDETWCKGNIQNHLPIEIGRTYRFSGNWATDTKWGPQFHFATYAQDYPHTQHGIIRYLIDNAPGVGAVTAQKAWIHFEKHAVEIMRDDPQRVASCGMLTLEDAQQVAAALKVIESHSKTTIDLLDIFHGRGFPKKLIREVFAKWGVEAPEKIRHDPFILLEHQFYGCGFKRCDRLFTDLGGNPGNMNRQMWCAWQAIKNNASGDTWQHITVAKKAVKSLIGGTGPKPTEAIRLAIDKKLLVLKNPDSKIENDKGWIAEPTKANDEEIIKSKLKELLDSPKNLWPKIQFADLSEHQQKEVSKALSFPVAILVGSPGVGKTWTAAAVIEALIQQYGQDAIAIAAPTGKAAVRCTAAMQRAGVDFQATTIHRLLGVEISESGGWFFKHNSANPLDKSFVIIDEASMLGSGLFAFLLSALSPGTHLFLIGDKNQLPPVEHGAPLRDLMKLFEKDSERQYGELTEIRRNAGLIVRTCVAIRQERQFSGCTNLSEIENFQIIHMKSQDDFLPKILSVIRGFPNFDPIDDIQVLCAVNSKSALSRNVLNKALQTHLNPNGRSVVSNPFRVGDKIICLKNGLYSRVTNIDPGDEQDAGFYKCRNNKQDFLANGEVGRVIAISERMVIAKFPYPDRLIRLPFYVSHDPDLESDANDFDLAYAITGHKSQGSEWPVIIGVIDGYYGASFVASREWWYTVISRATKYCILLGDKAILDRQCKKTVLNKRKTFLVESFNEDCRTRNC